MSAISKRITRLRRLLDSCWEHMMAVHVKLSDIFQADQDQRAVQHATADGELVQLIEYARWEKGS